VSRKAYEKPGQIPFSKASELAKTDIKHFDTEIPYREQINDDFILILDTREFTARIKERLKEIEEE